MDPTGDQLRAARSWLGWSLDDAAEKSAIHYQTISKLERGLSPGSRETIRRLVKTYADAGIWLEHDLIERVPFEE